MLTTVLFAMGLNSALLEDKPLSCPTTGETIEAPGPVVEYSGVKFTFCCPGCDDQFIKDPTKTLKANKKSGLTIGESLFDPVSQTRIKKIGRAHV